MTGWRTTHLGAVVTLQRGFDLPSRLRRRGTTPIVSSSGISGWHDQPMVKAPGVVTGRYGTIGEVFFEEVDFWPLNTTLWVSNFHGNDKRFVYYLLQRINFAAHSGKSGVPGVNRNDLHSELVSLPLSVDDQRVIADALSDCDNLISALERQIAKERAIKQGMMQQLLTGRTRLQGFEGVWEYHLVAEMGDVLAGKALNVSGAGALRPYLRTKNVLDGRIDLEDVLWMPMTDVEFERFRIECGDVLLNEGQSLELVGRCSIYSGEFGTPCAMQNQLLRFRSYPGTSPEFAAHLFRYCQWAGAFSVIATKTTSVAHLGSSRLSNLRLLWPTDRREQAAIAEVLSDMDAEITAHEVRLDKARAVKQGMMQQLLTGRTRLPVMESAA